MENKQHTQETALRKDSHLALALDSQVHSIDERFYYEPMLSAHPSETDEWNVQIGAKTMRYPLWISSMTGGTDKTNEINQRLAIAAQKFGLGMGAGSSRIALEDETKVADFNLRPFLGDDVPYYLNFGIAQIEKSIQEKSLDKIQNLLAKVNADGVIIHVNPLQEWLQPEGDKIQNSPLETIQKFISETHLKPIVKEVGQGFGYESMKQLLQLPLTAVEFAANGGTNFSKLELLRNKLKNEYMMPLVHVGHTAQEMVELSNRVKNELGTKIQCPTVIISGGIKTFLDGYYCIQKSEISAVYGQASELLIRAQQSQERLEEFIKNQIEGLLLARAFLTLKK
ncbi:MAG TPA: isopentenyl-diphosphate delta-isomerase [Crocinitomicaceae bacterium]|nr:isopentenyl-diphosphate delta-isomerase [Crocinitomicaceae bacterium]